MQSLNKLDLLPLESTLEVASLKDQQHGASSVELSPVASVNSLRSPAMKAPVPVSGSRKERRRNKTSSSVANVAEHEPTKTSKLLRSQNKEEEEGPEKKRKEVVESEAAVVDDDIAPKVWNLRPRRKPENMQKNRQLGSTSVSKVDPKAAYQKKFSVSLSKKEIEKDFLLMTGRKPAQKPKKRNMEVNKQIAGLQLGSTLKSVCVEAYTVREKPSTKWFRC